MARAYLGRYNPEDKAALIAAYEKFVANPPEYIGCDTETVSLKDNTIKGISFATLDEDAFYFTIGDPSMPWHILHNPKYKKVWQNATYDLQREALGMFGADIHSIEDTAMILRLLNKEVELSTASRLYLPEAYWTYSVPEAFDEYKLKGKDRQMSSLPPWKVMDKGLRDAQATIRLFEKFHPQVDQEYYRIKMKSTSLMLAMSHRPIKLDEDYVNALNAELGPQAVRLKQVCIDVLGFNPNSEQQIIQAFNDIGIVVPFRRGKPSTAEEDLLKIRKDGEVHPWVQMILKSRKFTKMFSTYVNKHVGHQFMYTHLHLDAGTGRSTSSKENIQNIPTGLRPGDIRPKTGPIRGQITPTKHKVMTSLDLSQIELRAFAHLVKMDTGDSKLQDDLNVLDKSSDIHSRTKQEVQAKDRVQAKNVNFGAIFSGFDFNSAETIARGADITNIDLVIRVIEWWRDTYPIAFRWAREQRNEARRTLKTKTIYGRTLDIGRSRMKLSTKHIDNCAINWPVQGSAFEVFERLMIHIWEKGYIPLEDFMFQVHDEVNFDGAYIDVLEPHRYELEHLAPFWTPYKAVEMDRWGKE